MKTLYTVLITLALTGCATPPQWLAAVYDNNDMCQFQNVPGRTNNEKVLNQPSYCGAGAKRQYIYATPRNQPLGAPTGYVNSR